MPLDLNPNVSMGHSRVGISYRNHFLDLFLSYYLSTENPADKKRKRRDVFDDISLKNKPEKELRCRIRIRIKYGPYYLVYFSRIFSMEDKKISFELHLDFVYP